MALVVGGAILAVGWFVSQPDGGNTGPSSTAAVDVDLDSDFVLACVPALEPACDTVAGALEIESEGWSAGQSLPDRGVVLAPAADFEPDTEVGPVVLESPIVYAGWRDRWQILQLACDDVVDAACVVGAAGTTWAELQGSPDWGDFKLALADPTASEPGMLAWSLLAPQVGGREAAVASALRSVGRTDARLMADLVAFGDSRADVVVTTEAAVMAQFQNAINRGGRFEIGYPASGPWVEYAAVAVGRGSDGLVETLQSEEAAQRFTAAGVRPVGGVVGAVPDGMGTAGEKTPSPDAASRATLTSLWEEIR